MITETDFQFLDPGTLRDGELEVVLVDTVEGDPIRGYAPRYAFEMYVDGAKGVAGRINLRCANTRNIVTYAGHIGYDVAPEHRGHRYAARSCRLLFPLARQHGLNPLWITCNPDNIASRRTCEIAGLELVEIVDLPPDGEMYRRGERQKCRYRLYL